jgi:DNA-directed RNA polymerase specialized sigma subunit, sigma54 homolog
VRQPNTDNDVAALDMIAADVGLRQHLHGQINVLPLDQRDHALACAIIESLDDDGYLRVDLDEIASTAGMNPAVEAAEMQIALKRVQSLDPLASPRATSPNACCCSCPRSRTRRCAKSRARSSPTISTDSRSTTSTAWRAT